MLNRTDRSSPTPGEAEVKYLDGDFRVVRPGAFVRCAVTGAAIPLEELRYWSVDLQEAYATPEAVLQRHSAALCAQVISRSRRLASKPPTDHLPLRIMLLLVAYRPSRTGKALTRAASAARYGSPVSRTISFSVVTQHQVFSIGARDQRLRLCGRVAMVIGKAHASRRPQRPFGEGRKKFFRVGDAGEGQHLASAERRERVAIRFEATVE